MQIINHILIEDGKAYIAGHRHLKAEMVARMVVDGAYSIEAVMEQYELSAAEVHAALSYYYDNQQELDARNEQKWADVRNTATNAEVELSRIKNRRS